MNAAVVVVVVVVVRNSHASSLAITWQKDIVCGCLMATSLQHKQFGSILKLHRNVRSPKVI